MVTWAEYGKKGINNIWRLRAKEKGSFDWGKGMNKGQCPGPMRSEWSMWEFTLYF